MSRMKEKGYYVLCSRRVGDGLNLKEKKKKKKKKKKKSEQGFLGEKLLSISLPALSLEKPSMKGEKCSKKFDSTE